MNKKQLGFFNGATKAICKEARKPVANDEDKTRKSDNLNLLRALRRAFTAKLPE